MAESVTTAFIGDYKRSNQSRFVIFSVISRLFMLILTASLFA